MLQQRCVSSPIDPILYLNGSSAWLCGLGPSVDGPCVAAGHRSCRVATTVAIVLWPGTASLTAAANSNRWPNLSTRFFPDFRIDWNLCESMYAHDRSGSRCVLHAVQLLTHFGTVRGPTPWRGRKQKLCCTADDPGLVVQSNTVPLHVSSSATSSGPSCIDRSCAGLEQCKVKPPAQIDLITTAKS